MVDPITIGKGSGNVVLIDECNKQIESKAGSEVPVEDLNKAIKECCDRINDYQLKMDDILTSYTCKVGNSFSTVHPYDKVYYQIETSVTCTGEINGKPGKKEVQIIDVVPKVLKGFSSWIEKFNSSQMEVSKVIDKFNCISSQSGEAAYLTCTGTPIAKQMPVKK